MIMKVARIYLRVSTEDQDLTRQEAIIENAKKEGFYIAGVYREKASGARADRAELNRMIEDLQPGEVVVAEKIDRVSRLPLPEAQRLIDSIRSKGARLAIPGIIDLTELVGATEGVAKIILESLQDMLLRLALQVANDDYEERRRRQREGVEQAKKEGKYKGRKADHVKHSRIIGLRKAGQSISSTAVLVNCSESLVKQVWAAYKKTER